MHQAPLSMEFSRQECWGGLPFPSPGDLPYPGMNPGLLHCTQSLVHPAPLDCGTINLFLTSWVEGGGKRVPGEDPGGAPSQFPSGVRHGPVPLGGQTGPARPKAPILSHAVRLSSGQTHPPALLASEILSSGRTSQVALGSLPGVKDQGQTSLWVRLTLHHTRLQFGTGEGIGEGQGPRSAGGQEGLRTTLLRLGCAHTLKVIDLHVAPGIWRLLLWLVAGHLQVFLTAVACWV